MCLRIMIFSTQQINPFSLVFRDKSVEHNFLAYLRSSQGEFLQVGYGFLVVFYMGIALAQVLLVAAPIYSNLFYAGLGLLALAAYSLLHPEQYASLRSMLGFSGVIVFGAMAGVFLPSSSVILQLTSFVVTLIWAVFFSGFSFRQISILFGGVPLLVVVFASLSASPMVPPAVLASMALSSVFILLLSYVFERQLRDNFYSQLKHGKASWLRAGKSLRVAGDASHSLQILKDLTTELSAVAEPDRFYVALLRHVKRVSSYDMVAIGRVRNERFVPVLMRAGNDDDIDAEDTLKLLWQSQLVQQLKKDKAPLIGQAEMGLLPSALAQNDGAYGYRLDIPFFAQGRLDGVVTLLRSYPMYDEAEAALIASVIFHGLFAYRVARLQQQPQKPAQPQLVTALDKAVANDQIMSVDEFLKQANTAFRYAQNKSKPVSLLLIEVDKYNQIIQKFGPDAGQAIAKLLTRLIAEHSVPNALLGRYGSSSFAVQLPLALPRAKQIAEKLCQLTRQKPVQVNGRNIQLTVSVGVAAKDKMVSDFMSLVRDADIGLYMAREEKGNAVKVSH